MWNNFFYEKIKINYVIYQNIILFLFFVPHVTSVTIKPYRIENYNKIIIQINCCLKKKKKIYNSLLRAYKSQ